MVHRVNLNFFTPRDRLCAPSNRTELIRTAMPAGLVIATVLDLDRHPANVDAEAKRKRSGPSRPGSAA